jgi:CelD/BcsL family acetyltransferase involved in cellulose biosynthesis
VTITAIDSVEGLEQLKPEWWELFRRCPRATPFQSPQWLVPWTRHLFRGGAIWALAMRDGEELAGFAPLFRWGSDRFTVSFLGSGISDYGDLLFVAGRERECTDALWGFLRDQQECWDVLDLQELRCGSGLLEGRTAEECSVCPVLRLAGYPEAMDHKHRIDVRRALNKLRKHSDLRFVMADETNLPDQMADFFGLHEMRWGTLDGSLRQFHCEAAAEFLEAGLLRLCQVQIDGAPGASIYAFAAGHTLYCYLSGFDPALAKLSPGAVLLGWLIEQAVAEGVQEVDFLRQTEPYKYLWGARDRVNYRIRA